MNDKELEQAREHSTRAAAHFDEQPDHGLLDPAVRRTCAEALQRWLPPPPAMVLDVGCGTGSLTVLMDALEHPLTGIDLALEMIRRAQEKAAAGGVQIPLSVINAADPDFPAESFEAVVCRHLLWTFPEPPSYCAAGAVC